MKAKTPKYFWFRSMRTLCRWFCNCFLTVEFKGIENIPDKGPLLLLSNHQSYLDPLFCGIKCKRPLFFMARDTLFKNPFFGRLIRSVNAIPVRRGEADLTAMKAIITKLREGQAVCLYPEATRTPDGKIAQVKAGFRLLSRKGDSAILPVLIDGAYECWPRHQKKPRLFSRISVWYGQPISAEAVSKMKDDELSEHLTSTLRNMQAQCRLEKSLQPFDYGK